MPKERLVAGVSQARDQSGTSSLLFSFSLFSGSFTLALMERPPTLALRQLAASLSADPKQNNVLQQPPYAPGFAEWLAYEFVGSSPSAVPGILAQYFPNPDQVDCHYLASVLQQIEHARTCEREVGCGVDLVFHGIEYAALHMIHARQWLTTTQASLTKQAGS
jgi:hypothetical protein